MREVIRELALHADLDVVVLAGLYEREYRGQALAVLREMAEIARDCSYLLLRPSTLADCRRCEQERVGRVEHLLETMLGDPFRAHGGLKGMIDELRQREGRGAEMCRRCRGAFLEGVLQPMISSLGAATLVKGVEGTRGREGYAKLLQPLVKPCFLTSRLLIEPPTGAKLVDAYEIKDAEVRIYNLPNELQHMYFLVPSEYRLPPEKVSLLYKVRSILLSGSEKFSMNPLERDEFERKCMELIARVAGEDRLEVAKRDIEALARCLAKFTLGLGVLETLLSDDGVQDIYIDAPVGRTPVHLYHRDFEESVSNIYLTPGDAESLVSKFRAISGRPFSEADPVLDLDLQGVRVAAIGRPLSPEGTAFALRRHKPTPWTLPQLVRGRFLTPYAAGLLSLLIDGQTSLLVTGSRGAGKTSLLGALMLEILPKFRIIVLEDTAELPVAQLRSLGFKVQALRVQAAVSASGAELSAQDALRAALRLGESVLVVGEVRGPEAACLYEAMRIGAAGNSVMGTIHGSSARDVFERVVRDLGIPPSSFKATDIIVVASLIRRMGGVARSRRVTQITELCDGWGEDPTSESGFEDLMSYDPAADELRPTRTLRGLRSRVIADIARKWGT
ncbi:MAG: type II/IV secretion system ATPase subunit, partial [Hadesarchaea archaeon]|nr:type II/IV secretion system ATPase subunit [Hadesarchaea archaeon]